MINPLTFIFDFDGTIADTHHYIVEISNKLSEEFHYAKIRPEELSELKHKTAQEIIRHLNIPLLKIPTIIARAKKEFQNDILDLNPIQGLNEILPAIKAAGIQIGILSSNAIDNIKTFLTHHGLDIFDFVHSTPSIWGKHLCLNKLIATKNIPLESIIYIGDELRDIQAAKKLGVKIAAVTWGYNSEESLQKLNPDYLCRRPSDLLDLILLNTQPA